MQKRGWGRIVASVAVVLVLGLTAIPRAQQAPAGQSGSTEGSRGFK